MGVVFLVYLLIMPLIWDFGDEEERMFMTALMLGLTAPAAMLFLRSIYNDSTRVAGFAGIGSGKLAPPASFWATRVFNWSRRG